MYVILHIYHTVDMYIQTSIHWRVEELHGIRINREGSSTCCDTCFVLLLDFWSFKCIPCNALLMMYTFGITCTYGHMNAVNYLCLALLQFQVLSVCSYIFWWNLTCCYMALQNCDIITDRRSTLAPNGRECFEKVIRLVRRSTWV